MTMPHIKAALLMATASSVLLFGYEVVRSASYTLFKTAYGAAALPFMLAVLPFFMLPVLMLYNRTLLKVGPRRTLLASGLVSGLAIVACYGVMRAGFSWGSALLLLVQETYAVLMVEQFWSFINSSLSEDEAKRYNGLVLTISTVGAIAGGACVHLLAERLGTLPLVGIAGVLCLPALYLIGRAFDLHTPMAPAPSAAEQGGDLVGLALLRRHKALVMILLMIIASQVYGTVLGFNFQNFLEAGYPQPDRQTAISGLFFASLNVCSIVLQLIIAPWLLSFVPIAIIHLGIPLIHCVMMLAALLEPGFTSVALAFMAFKAVDYSLFRAAKEILYIPLSFDARYRTKELIDVFGYRFSKSGTSLMITVCQKLGFVFAAITYLWMGMIASLAWLLFLLPLVHKLYQENKTKDLPPPAQLQP